MGTKPSRAWVSTGDATRYTTNRVLHGQELLMGVWMLATACYGWGYSAGNEAVAVVVAVHGLAFLSFGLNLWDEGRLFGGRCKTA
jgi:hypothetical protein